jgi:hypothetical protein
MTSKQPEGHALLLGLLTYEDSYDNGDLPVWSVPPVPLPPQPIEVRIPLSHCKCYRTGTRPTSEVGMGTGVRTKGVRGICHIGSGAI